MHIACLFNDHFIWRSQFIFVCIFSVTCYRFTGAKIVLHTTSCMEDLNILLTITNNSPIKYTCCQFTSHYHHHHHYLLHAAALSRPSSGRNKRKEKKCIKTYRVISFENSGSVCVCVCVCVCVYVCVCVKHSSKLRIHNMNND